MTQSFYFDTLAYANKLKAVEVPAKQAEIQAETFVEFFGELTVIRRDIEDVRRDIGDVRQEINNLRNEMNAKFSDMKAETIKWVAGTSAAQATIIISMLKVLH